MKHTLSLLLVAILLAGLMAAINPHDIAWNPDSAGEGEILLEDAQVLLPPAIWVDARELGAYEEGHIPGALLLNETSWETLLDAFMDIWTPERTIIVYCDSRQCGASHKVAQRLKDELGIDNVYVLRNGWSAWQSGQAK